MSMDSISAYSYFQPARTTLRGSASNFWWAYRDSNPDSWFKRPVFYPLNYRPISNLIYAGEQMERYCSLARSNRSLHHLRISFGSGGGIRTPNLSVNSRSRCHCATPEHLNLVAAQGLRLEFQSSRTGDLWLAQRDSNPHRLG